MDSILEPFPAERLFPAAGPGFLDLGDFSEADFLSNVVRGDPRGGGCGGAAAPRCLPDTAALPSLLLFIYFLL